MAAGPGFAIKHLGIRAMDSLRREKSWRLIPREMSIEYPAVESGLECFVRLDEHVDACGSEAIYQDGRVVGRATSGGYS